MPDPLLVRDVMRIGVPTCKLEDTVAHVAALMIDGGHTAVVVLDSEADSRGWINERILASAYEQAAATHEDASALPAPEYIQDQGAAAPRPTPMDLFRQRYGLASKR